VDFSLGVEDSVKTRYAGLPEAEESICVEKIDGAQATVLAYTDNRPTAGSTGAAVGDRRMAADDSASAVGPYFVTAAMRFPDGLSLEIDGAANTKEQQNQMLAAIRTIRRVSNAKGQRPPCHRADEVSDALIAEIKNLMGRDSSRRKALSLAAAADSTIAVVADSRICARAGQAVDSVALHDDQNQVLKPAVNPIYVFRIGASHGVRFSGGPDSHFEFVMFFGPSWEYLSVGAF